MANWLDFLALIATISVVGGIVYGIIYVIRSINEGLTSTKASLKSRGLDVSASGVSIKTSRRFEREAYVDATQRGIVKAMGAASFKRSESSGGLGDSGSGGSQKHSSPPSIHRQDSTASTGSEEKKKKRNIFGKK